MFACEEVQIVEMRFKMKWKYGFSRFLYIFMHMPEENGSDRGTECYSMRNMLHANWNQFVFAFVSDSASTEGDGRSRRNRKKEKKIAKFVHVNVTRNEKCIRESQCVVCLCVPYNYNSWNIKISTNNSSRFFASLAVCVRVCDICGCVCRFVHALQFVEV